MKKILLSLFVLLYLGAEAQAQSYAFGIKGGLTTGFQRWDGFNRDPLFKYHGILFIESAEETNKFALFAQLGYHVKGSAIRNQNAFNVNTGVTFRPPTREFQFRNISLTVGGKQKYDWGSNKVYYLFGLRGDYTVDTNLEQYQEFNETFPRYAIYPFTGFVRQWNYGVTVGGGMEIPLSYYVSAIVEFTVNPDFSRQYVQPAFLNIFDPVTGNNVSSNEREIRNTTFEITVGFRFLREIEYID